MTTTITLTGSIDPNAHDEIQATLATLDRTQPLTVILNSDGGSVQHGIGIYNVLRTWPSPITVEIQGWALSVASIILQAGTVRRIHPTGAVMVHAPWLITSGNASDLREKADMLDRISTTMLQAYRRTRKTDAAILDWFDGKDHWFTAEEALAAGLVDEIIQTDQMPQFANASATKHPIPSYFSKRIFSMNTQQNTNLNNISEKSMQASEIARKEEINNRISLMASRNPEIKNLINFCLNDPGITPDAAVEMALTRLGSGAEPATGSFFAPALAENDYINSKNREINKNNMEIINNNRIHEFENAARDHLLIRAGLLTKENAHPAARDVSRFSITDIAERVLSMGGRDMHGAGRDAIISAALSTSDFPDLLGAAASKAMQLGYEMTSDAHAIFTSERDVPDFKKNTLVNISEAPGLLEVRELAEYEHGTLLDSGSEFQVSTFGRLLTISRQALINDDIGAFTALPNALGAAARRKEADLVFGLLTGNPLLKDGKTLFHASHGNIGPAAKLSIESLSLARAAMRKQKGIGGLGYLDPTPRFLIVPASLETLAEQLIASLVDPSKANDTPSPAFVRGLTVVADPRLDATSETAWYLAADPRQVDTIVRAYLAGQPRPYLEENPEFSRDAMSWKVRLDFGVGVIDYRGLFKNDGV